MSVFDKPGLYLRNPHGGVEGLAEMRAAGFESVAINVRDYPLSEWDEVRRRAVQNGMKVLPWGRCLHNEEVTQLCDTARGMGVGAVLVNSERELKSGDVDEGHIVAECKGLDACVSMEPWVVGVNIPVLKELRIHLQMFPQESDTSTRPRDCKSRAYRDGAKYAYIMQGIHGLAPIQLSPCQGAYWVYTADDTGNNYEPWAPVDPIPLAVPFKGPLYPMGHPKHQPRERPNAVRALKIACHRAGYWDFYAPDGSYGIYLKRAMENLQREWGLLPSGAYGLGTHNVLRKLMAVQPREGYALTDQAADWLGT